MEQREEQKADPPVKTSTFMEWLERNDARLALEKEQLRLEREKFALDQRKVETEIVAIKEGSAAIVAASAQAVQLAKEASEALAGVIRKSEENTEAIQELRTELNQTLKTAVRQYQRPTKQCKR